MFLLCVIINLTVAIAFPVSQFDGSIDSWNNGAFNTDSTFSDGYQLGHDTGQGYGHNAVELMDGHAGAQELGDIEYAKHYNTLLLSYGRTGLGYEDLKRREDRGNGRSERGWTKRLVRTRSGKNGGRKEVGGKGWLEKRFRNERDQFTSRERVDQYRSRYRGDQFRGKGREQFRGRERENQFRGRERGNLLSGGEKGDRFRSKENGLVGFGAFNYKRHTFW